MVIDKTKIDYSCLYRHELNMVPLYHLTVSLLRNSEYTVRTISKKTNISEAIVGKIKRGEYARPDINLVVPIYECLSGEKV